MDSMEPVDGRLCESFQSAVELVGKRWTGAIITVLRDGPLRYTRLAMAVPGVSERLLSERLRELEGIGIVVRRVLPGPPVGVEYELSESGRELGEAMDPIAAWARRWMEPAPGDSPEPAVPLER
jgi:DNA-binding HxlR family transcriptional regulator